MRPNIIISLDELRARYEIGFHPLNQVLDFYDLMDQILADIRSDSFKMKIWDNDFESKVQRRLLNNIDVGDYRDIESHLELIDLLLDMFDEEVFEFFKSKLVDDLGSESVVEAKRHNNAVFIFYANFKFQPTGFHSFTYPGHRF